MQWLTDYWYIKGHICELIYNLQSSPFREGPCRLAGTLLHGYKLSPLYMFQVLGPPPPPTHGHGTLVIVASSNPPSPCGVGWCGVGSS